jgi:hypothetical protein
MGKAKQVNENIKFPLALIPTYDLFNHSEAFNLVIASQGIS